MLLLLEQLQYLVTFALIGLIWTIQLIHYPAFQYIESDRFVEFEKMHTVKISFIVAPLMLIEIITSVMILTLSPHLFESSVLLFTIVLIWLSTFFLSVPCHQILAKGKDDLVIQKLIHTNWLRTILWSIKGVLICVF